MTVIVDLKTQKQIKVNLPSDQKAAGMAMFSLDDSLLVLLSLTTMLAVDANTGQMMHDLFPQSKDIWSSSVFNQSRDLGKFMVTAHMLANNLIITPGVGIDGKKTLYLIDLRKGSVKYEMKGHGYDIGIVQLSRDKNRAVSGTTDTVSSSHSGEKRIRLWDLRTGKQVNAFCTQVVIFLYESSSNQNNFY